MDNTIVEQTYLQRLHVPDKSHTHSHSYTHRSIFSGEILLKYITYKIKK